MRAPLVVFAVGNPSRGDDAIGPALCRHLDERVQARGLADQVELIEDFQLNIEHALDLCERRLALFVDAGEQTPAPYRFARAVPSTAIGHSTHALPPENVLGVYRQTEGDEPPPAFVLGVRGECFELGEGLSSGAQAHLGAACRLLEELLDDLSPEAWEARCT